MSGRKRHPPGSEADIPTLLDHFVGAPNQRVGDLYAKRLGGFEIEDHLNFRGLIDRQISGFFTFKYAATVNADLPVPFGVAGSVTQQGTRRGKLAIRKDRGYSMASCKLAQSPAAAGKKCIGTDYEPAQSELGQAFKGRIEFVIAARIQDVEF